MNEWMNNPAMKNLDPLKLELIKTAARQTEGKTGKSLAPVLMALITNANKKGIQFSPDEITLILEMLKEGKSKQEKDQIDQMLKMVMGYIKNKKQCRERISSFPCTFLKPFFFSHHPDLSSFLGPLPFFSLFIIFQDKPWHRCRMILSVQRHHGKKRMIDRRAFSVQ